MVNVRGWVMSHVDVLAWIRSNPMYSSPDHYQGIIVKYKFVDKITWFNLQV